MDPENGYNLKEGGSAGRLSDQAIEKLSVKGKLKWQNNEYQEKQLKKRRELSNDPEFVAKMTEINQEIARNPETREKMSNSLSERWQDPKYQDRISSGVSDKWQDAEYRERQLRAKTDGKRKITDKMKFLGEIKELSKKDLVKRYDMDGKCINKRIREMLSHQGVSNYSEAKKYLENKDPKEILKDINEKISNQSERYQRTNEITDKKQFLQDIQNLKKTELNYKYDMGGKTINRKIGKLFGDTEVKNYSEAKKFLKDKNIDEVLKDINKDVKEEKNEEKSPDDIEEGAQTDKKPHLNWS